MKPTGIVRDDIFLKHNMGAYHPESPHRLEAIYQKLDELQTTLSLQDIPVREALPEEIAANHSPAYVDRIASTAGRGNTYLDPDTSACADTWEAASKAAGGLLNLVDALSQGEVRNGIALVRPPGHHAEWDRAMGFCFFNNIAIAARYAIQKLGLRRVAIVDWDLHHGNGTQHSFYDSDEVLFFSVHQYPHYPGTGAVREVGSSSGEGYTVNVPLGPGAGDAEYVAVFNSILAPVLQSFQPDLILVSAGFDAHRSDPLGGMGLSEDGYDQLLQIVMHMAAEFCAGRVALTLEGGYNLGALAESVGRVLTTLSSYDPEKAEPPLPPAAETLHPRTVKMLSDVADVFRPYWSSLSQQ